MEKNNNLDSEEETLIKSYIKLLAEVDQKTEDLRNPDNPQVVGYMNQTQKLFAKIKSPRPLTLDAKVTKRVSSIVRDQGQQMTSNIINFNIEEFSQKILQKVGADPLGGRVSKSRLVRLGQTFSVKFKASPVLSYLYGAVAAQPQETEDIKKQRKVRKVPNTGPLKETCSVDVRKGNAEVEEGTDQLVINVHRCLVEHFKKNGKQPVDYFQFIINPASFSKTIENMFHVSFLVKEGKARISVSKESGLPIISPVGRTANKETEIEETNQVVMNIRVSDWKILAEKYADQYPIIS